MSSGIYAMSKSALYAAQAALDVTAHNISNANTPGYSRQSLEIATEEGQFSGSGFLGRGVRIANITRATNEALTKESNINIAAAASDATRLNKLEQLEKTLPLGEQGLGYSASQFLNSFVDISNQPLDMSARQVALARAQEWVSRVRTADQQLTQLQSGVISDLSMNISQVNNLTKQIGEVNQSIANLVGTGKTPNDLLDRRDKLLADLNKLVQVNTVPAGDGTLTVFLGGGQLLVLGNKAQKLSVARDLNDGSLARIAIQTPNSNDPTQPDNRILDGTQLTGGAVQGLLNFQDQDLVAIRRDLQDFVEDFANAVNTQQALGSSGQDALGNPIPGSPIFGGGPPITPGNISVALTAPADIAASGGGTFVASDNENALAMLGLRDQAIIELDNLNPSTLTDAYSQMIGNLGVKVQSGRTEAEISRILEDNSTQMLSGETGVNLDEEAAMLIQYQQSYQAAAKALQVAQTVFETLLSIR